MRSVRSYARGARRLAGIVAVFLTVVMILPVSAYGHSAMSEDESPQYEDVPGMESSDVRPVEGTLSTVEKREYSENFTPDQRILIHKESEVLLARNGNFDGLTISDPLYGAKWYDGYYTRKSMELVSSQWKWYDVAAADFDGDGIGDNADGDDDNDGVPDERDAFPDDPDEWSDNDGDGIGDNADMDDDNDGYNDTVDAFPDDPDEWNDNDGDGIGDNADPDDDNDGYSDAYEIAAGSDPESASSLPYDRDHDGIPDALDEDDDNDGYNDTVDAFPDDPREWVDSDGDGIGDNEDMDDDNDGLPDVWEISYGMDPLNPADASLDVDGDGLSALEEYESGTSPLHSDAVQEQEQQSGTQESSSLPLIMAILALVVALLALALAFRGRNGGNGGDGESPGPEKEEYVSEETEDETKDLKTGPSSPPIP